MRKSASSLLLVLAVAFVFPTLSAADTSSINSAVVIPRVFNDVPGATFTGINSYPSSIFLGEANVSAATGFANRDVWRFSNNGTTAYQFQNSDYFTASFDLTLTGSPITPRKEAGFLLSTANVGDIQLTVDTDAHEVVQFGGLSFWSFTGNDGLTYNSGDTIHLGLSYYLDASNEPALQFFANGFSSPVFEIPGGIGDGSTLGGYFQIWNDPFNPENQGSALFQNVAIAVPTPEPGSVLLLGTGLASLAGAFRSKIFG